MKKEESDQRLSQKNNIMIVFLWISFNIFQVSGSSDGKDVNQKPERIFSKLGPSVELICSHEIDTYNRIYWYKQVESKEMQFLGYMNVNNGYPEDEKKMKITGDARKSQVSAVTFNQSVPQIVKKNIEVRMTCKHDDTSLPVMLWYRQKKDNSLTLIGYAVGKGTPSYEGRFEEEYTLTKESSESGALIVKNTNLSHSAVYYCAASNTVMWFNDALLLKTFCYFCY
ncbi:hypothetical protein F2P81_003054 [Xyrichtys novacula]|uniref:Ig-like domain-containing protein n=1 Tax=Xyrichtys novacula TaxID=13765 RepID=A0AAV1GN89_XYRNO|nr:hypothetical protein F2P81_003054 [Xyrichtys novacula]